MGRVTESNSQVCQEDSLRSRALGPCKLPQEALAAGDTTTAITVIGDPVWPQQPEAWENGGGASLVLCRPHPPVPLLTAATAGV